MLKRQVFRNNFLDAFFNEFDSPFKKNAFDSLQALLYDFNKKCNIIFYFFLYKIENIDNQTNLDKNNQFIYYERFHLLSHADNIWGEGGGQGSQVSLVRWEFLHFPFCIFGLIVLTFNSISIVKIHEKYIIIFFHFTYIY